MEFYFTVFLGVIIVCSIDLIASAIKRNALRPLSGRNYKNLEGW